MELKLHHVNYSTKDVGAVAEFYQSLFKMKPASGYEYAQITSQGYDRKVAFVTDGTTEFHIAPQDLGVAFRTKQSLNPLDRGHIAFRTDDIEAFKEMLREKEHSIRRLRRLGHRRLVSNLPAGPGRQDRGSTPDRVQEPGKSGQLLHITESDSKNFPTGVTRCASAALASATSVNQWRVSCSTEATNSGVTDVREEAMLPLLERQARRTSLRKELAKPATQLLFPCPHLRFFGVPFRDPMACWQESREDPGQHVHRRCAFHP